MPNKGIFHPSNLCHSIGGRIVRNFGRLSRRNSARQIRLDNCTPIGEHGLIVRFSRPNPGTLRAAMPYSDFDVSSLARYLHINPQKVVRLAERGKLPGRKVAGQWKFSRSEIHHWFEQHIGLSDEEGLVEVEDVLQRGVPVDQQEEISLVAMLPLEAIAVPLCARTRNSVIDSMVELAARTGWLWDAKAMADAVRAREDMHPTALENGVALLHPRRPMPQILAQAFLALGCTTTGIPFGGDAPLTDVFFLICSLEDRGHLRTLARLSRVLTARGVLGALHQATDARTIQEMIAHIEQKL